MLRGVLGGFARGRRQTSAATLYLDFLAGLNDPRITFSGGANGTRVNSAGVIVAATTPRFDYDPVTLAARGLLVEEARTNLLLRSQEFDNAAWTPSATTVSANATTSPDGTANADKLVEDSSTGLHRISQTAAKAASAITYTQTLYVKASERSIVQIIFADGGGFALGHFDVATGIKDTPIASGWASPLSTITAVGNGYYRVSLTATSTAAASVSVLYGICTGTIGAPAQSYTGNGTSGLFIWGTQLEAGSFPTSYIPTTSASVTRTADSAVMTGTNFSSWYNQSEGTFVCGFDTVESDATPGNVFEVGDGTFNERMNTFVSSTPTINWVVTDGGVQVVNFSTGSYVVGNVAKVGTTYALNSFAGSLNGGTPGTDTSGTLPTVNALYIGRQGAGGASLNGHIRTLQYFPRRLPNTQLQTLTA